MKRGLGLFLLVILVTGCQTKQRKLANILQLNDTMVYQKVEQGHFQETLYRAQYHSGIDLTFDVFEVYPGDFAPLTGIALQDKTASNFLFIKYVLEPDRHRLEIELRQGSQVISFESFPLQQPVEKISALWNENEISVLAGSVSKNLSVPFDIAYIATVASSVEVLHRVKFQRHD